MRQLGRFLSEPRGLKPLTVKASAHVVSEIRGALREASEGIEFQALEILPLNTEGLANTSHLGNSLEAQGSFV